MSGRILNTDLKWEYIKITKCSSSTVQWSDQTQSWEITNTSCVFPFSFWGVDYYGCSEGYCATKLDEHGDLLESGVCGSECMSDAETRIWKKADTLKLTLQYDNYSVIEIWIKVYGFLLTGIFIIGLILTTLLPAMST